MGGVVSGTAIMLAKEEGELHTITLTINNQCNLNCPHCYLQYKGLEKNISPEIIDYVINNHTDYKHIAIVGREPLFDGHSASICCDIIKKAYRKGLSVSLITNGLNIQLLDEAVLTQISFIDISLDGGRHFYSQYRGCSIDKIAENLIWLKNKSFNRINALEVLNSETIYHIDDMMDFATAMEVEKIMFSPYLPTDNQGENIVGFVSLNQCFRALKKSKPFMDSQSAFMMVDLYHCWHEGMSLDEARRIANDEDMSHKVFFVPAEPTALGIMRVTYDGLVLSSYNALHTQKYKSCGTCVNDYATLNEHYRSLLTIMKKAETVVKK